MGNKDNTFYVLDNKINLSNDLVLYNQLRNKFYVLASDSLDLFEKEYKKNSSLKNVVDNAPYQIAAALTPVLRECIDILINVGVFTLDEATFYEKYVSSIECWSNAYEEIEDIYAEIVLTKEQQALYRQRRRETRGRWIGGGFGFSGAVKGVAAAGALNMASGVGHAIFNGLGSIVSSIATNSKLEKTFKSPEIYEKLSNGVYFTVCRMHLCVANAIAEYTNNYSYLNGCPSNENRKNAEAIIGNVPRIADENIRKKALIDAFYLNPYSTDWYRYVYKTYGDKNSDLERLDLYFGVKLVSSYKEDILEEFGKTLSFESEKDILIAQEKISEYKEKIGFIGKSYLLADISKRLKTIDIEKRTVNGVLFETIEEADLNRKEFDSFCNDLDSVNEKDIDSLNAILNKLKSCKGKIANDYKNHYIKVKENLEKSLCTVKVSFSDDKTINFDSIEKAKAAKEYVEILDEALKNANKFNDKITYFSALHTAFRNDDRNYIFPEIADLFSEILSSKIEKCENTAISKMSEIREIYESMQKENKNHVHIDSGMDKTSKIVVNVRKAYLDMLGFKNDEIILMVFDNSALFSYKKGFTITNRGFYSTGHSMFDKFFIPKEEINISSIRTKGNTLVVNDKITAMDQSVWLTRDRIAEIVKRILLYVPTYGETTDITLPASKNVISLPDNILGTKYKPSKNRLIESTKNEKLTYRQIGKKIDGWMLRMPQNIYGNMYSGQNSDFFSSYSYDKAFEGYLKDCKYLEDYEFPVFSYSENKEFRTGFFISSRGIYIHPIGTSKKVFFSYEKNIPIEADLNKKTLILQSIPISLTDFSEFQINEFYDLVEFILIKTKEFNSSYAKQLDEDFKTGKITEDFYKKRMSALSF